MKLDRTLAATWQLTGADVPALATVTSRAHVVVLEDVETLCASIVIDLSRSDAPYAMTETSDLYDALGFLLGQVTVRLPKYDPKRGNAIHDPWTEGFKMWLHQRLTRDLIDQWRSWNGRNGHKRLARSYANDANDARREGDFGTEPDQRGSRERRSRGALTTDPGDSGDAGGHALRRLLESGDREVLREVEALGLGTAGRAGGRAQGADRGDAVEGLDLARVA